MDKPLGDAHRDQPSEREASTTKLQSLAEYLGTAPAPQQTTDVEPQLADVTDAKAFALAVLNSRDFRQYIVNQLTLGDIPPAIITRLMDYGWGKPADRVEHTGKDGGPVVTEIRRVIVRPRPEQDEEATQEHSGSVH